MDDEGRTQPSFEVLDDGDSIAVVDPLERRRLVLDVPAVSILEPERADPFQVPVDTVVAIQAARIQLRDAVGVVVRDERGEMVTEVQPLTETDLPAGVYQVELNAPIKVCLFVESALTITASVDTIAIEFPQQCRVHLGARSYHRRPAATVTTTDDPAAVAAALSVLGSALKTTSPERAYPTLRGHPPAIELGDELRLPSGLDRPETGVTIAVLGSYRALYAVAPLAYYLGAEVTISDRPGIVTEAGSVHGFEGSPRGLERGIERVLKQVFFLDCLIRTEGFYRLPLAERAAVEPQVDLDFAQLYDRPLARRLEAYLDVPFETVEPHLPPWNLIAHVPPTADQVEALPYVIDNLAIVRAPDAEPLSSAEVRTAVLADYAEGKSRSSPRGAGVRSGRAANERPDDERILRLAETDSMVDAWFGEGAPLNATKSLPQAYRNRLERSDSEPPIDVAVVCNEMTMESESAIADAVYGSGDDTPSDVALHRDVNVAELRSLFASDVDFVHYIGHTTADGFHCRDGRLDAATLDAAGAGTFFLNSCRSYRQGMHLIEAGCVGGVVTLSDVNDEGAAIVGQTMARLLNAGFPLRAAVQLASQASVVGGHYIVVGDGTADLVPPENGLPLACRVAAVDDHQFDVTFLVFLPREGGMGTTVYPLLASNDSHYLAPGPVTTFRVSEQELRDHLTIQPVPVISDGELILDGFLDRLGG